MTEYKINNTEATNNLEVYAKGFQDGWKMAMKMAKEESVKLNSDVKVVPTEPYYGCNVCKRTGFTSVVCNASNCPIRAYSGAIGTVGSISYPAGANGPADPAMSWEKR